MFQYPAKYERFVMEKEKKDAAQKHITIHWNCKSVNLTFSRRSGYHINGLSLHVE